ncbi:MAG: thymidylate kinase [Candidatus Saccharimonas sp.]
MSGRGKFIAIEGGDGSGKATQTKLLVERLQRAGREVYPLSFPRYGEHSAKILEKYLRGEFGNANDLPAELASLAFTIDRVAAKPALEAWLDNHPDGVVIADRYVLSNIAHQAARIADKQERLQFYEDLSKLEYDDLGLPRPDKNILLLVPAEVAQANIDKKATRSYTTKKRDIHESSVDHLTFASRNYTELAELLPELITPVKVFDDDSQEMRSISDIHDEIYQIVEAVLSIDNQPR